ncbi:hypothetical protein Kfla_4599 [Kribbella flavida DSM 17836]|uniref:ABM domain-containing protein n=1 Tax=Kribbella flavida (strain DSM 17836 / JCM 10339 / NBRC 14399) TaxID=479435 RepID=D2PY11_KRIFD|nr:hypothetical protein [Kribbella flavida]ADB33617.1 hypothetical protein Kfla_4599 [Kribbella flavida DSM 17836]
MAGFVQIIEYRTAKPDEVVALMTEFRAQRQASGEGPGPTRAMACVDRDTADRYVSIIEFASYEEAMENSKRSDTSEFAAGLAELCDGPPTFRNLDLLEAMDYPR